MWSPLAMKKPILKYMHTSNTDFDAKYVLVLFSPHGTKIIYIEGQCMIILIDQRF